MPRQQPFIETPAWWPEHSGLDYLGMEEHLEEEWIASQQEPEQKQEESDSDDEGEGIEVHEHNLPDVDPSTKRADPISQERQLLRHIDASTPHIATIGIQDTAMPDATPPAFVPVLSPVTSPVAAERAPEEQL